MSIKSIEINFLATSDQNGQIRSFKEYPLDTPESLTIYRYKIKNVATQLVDNLISLEIKETTDKVNFYVDNVSTNTETEDNMGREFLNSGLKKFEMEGQGFEKEIEVSVILTIEFVSSNMQDLANDVLVECLNEKIYNPLCAGISEHTLLSFASRNLDMVDKNKFDNSPDNDSNYIHFHIAESNNSSTLKFTIDADKELITCHSTIQLDFIHELPTRRYEVCCSALFTLSMDLKPMMTIETQDRLQFEIVKISLEGQIILQNVDQDKIAQYFKEISNIDNKINEIKKDLLDIDSKGYYANILATVAGNIVLPNTWDCFSGFQAKFEKFAYRKGFINNEIVGFLYLVFSIYSLNLPAPCICPDEESLIKKREVRLLDKLVPNVDWFVLGFSKDALNEVLRPIANQGIEDRKGSGGTVSWELYYWLITRFNTVIIQKSVLGIIIDSIKAGGRLSASIGFKCKKITKSVGVSVNLKGITGLFDFIEKSDHLYIKPEVSIKDFSIDIDAFPYPIDVIAEAAIEAFGGDYAKSEFIKKMEKQISLPIFKRYHNNVLLRYVKKDLYENISCIITLGAIYE